MPAPRRLLPRVIATALAALPLAGCNTLVLSPPGDVAGTLAALMAWPGERELTVRREEDGRAYEVRRT